MTDKNLSDEIKSISDWHKFVFGVDNNPYDKSTQILPTAETATLLAQQSLDRLSKT